MTLYERLAEQLQEMIERGVYTPGARLPSVRALTRQWQVSPSTITEAYSLLEDRGVVEVRPQSGHYVRGEFPPAAEPEVSRPEARPVAATVSDTVMEVMRHTAQPGIVPLAAALPRPDLLPLRALARCTAAVAREHPGLAGAYDSVRGCEALRTQIARRMAASRCTVGPEEIVTTAGCQEAVVLALRAVCRPGDAVAVESPTFFNFLQAIELLGLRALEVATHLREGIVLDALDRAVREHRVGACLLSTNCNNPLGATMSDAKKRELVELLARHDVPLIEDDIYGDLSFDGQRPCVAKAFDRAGGVLFCSSFSKTISPGYRVGWIAPGRYQAELERVKATFAIATSNLPHLAVAEFLASGGYDRHLRRVRRVYAGQVAAMAQGVARAFPPGTRVSRPVGGFVLWVEGPAELDAVALYRRAMTEGINFAPGVIFSASGRYRNGLRLNAAYWSPQTAEAVRRLGGMAGELMKGARGGSGGRQAVCSLEA